MDCGVQCKGLRKQRALLLRVCEKKLDSNLTETLEKGSGISLLNTPPNTGVRRH